MWQSTASKPCRDSSVQSGVVVVVDVLTGVVDVEDCTVVAVVDVVVVDRRVVLVVDVVVVLVVGSSVVDVVVVCATVVVVVCGTIVVVVTASVEDVDVVVVVVACPGQSGGTGGLSFTITAAGEMLLECTTGRCAGSR